MYMTVMWQECYGSNTFFFQSNDPAVLKRMRERKDFSLFNFFVNARDRVYKAEFYSPKEARRTLGRITRQKIKWIESESLYLAQTGAIIALNEDSHPEISDSELTVAVYRIINKKTHEVNHGKREIFKSR